MPIEEGVTMLGTIQGLVIRGGRAMLVGVACGVSLVFVLGRGDDDGLGPRYTVHGRVMYESRPLEIGRITFYPIDNSRTARHAIGTVQDGYYALSTIGDDGALPGRYRVAIVAKSGAPSPLQPIVPGGATRHSDVI